MSLEVWAQAQIAQLLPLDDDSLKQIVDYSNSLDPESAASHLKDILGDSDLATTFISTYRDKRSSQDGKTASHAHPQLGLPTHQGHKKKNKANFNRLPEVRRPEDHGNISGAYHKKDDPEEYMPSARLRAGGGGSMAAALTSEPEARQLPRTTGSMGLLDASMPNVHTRTSSPAKTPRTNTPSPSSTPRNSSPRPASTKTSAKVSIAGGTPMHGASATLSDLESALRSLEMSTNPTIPPPDPSVRRCPCMGTVHPVLAAAPNCLSCGKIICAKEGLAPCTFCGSPLLTPAQVQDMVRALRDERGREKQAVNNATHQRAQVAATPKPFAAARDASPAEGALKQAQAHRDRLLGFQATNAARTKVVDEAAAYETPDAGVSQWSSAMQRAAQLKRQQKVLREMEWNARPEYEKRKVVVSVDLVGGKIVRRMADVSRAEALGQEEEDDDDYEAQESNVPVSNGSGGAFARNPLLGKLIRPTWQPKESEANGSGKTNGGSKGKGIGKEQTVRASSWRRVQDDLDDNEAIVLDGGTFGGQDRNQLNSEESEYS